MLVKKSIVRHLIELNFEKIIYYSLKEKFIKINPGLFTQFSASKSLQLFSIRNL